MVVTGRARAVIPGFRLVRTSRGRSIAIVSDGSCSPGAAGFEPGIPPRHSADSGPYRVSGRKPPRMSGGAPPRPHLAGRPPCGTDATPSEGDQREEEAGRAARLLLPPLEGRRGFGEEGAARPDQAGRRDHV